VIFLSKQSKTGIDETYNSVILNYKIFYEDTFCILALIFSTFCFAQKEFQPKNSKINETVEGDLDGDKILKSNSL
jgi:hypothetical protein